jgi:hypothetical protein
VIIVAGIGREVHFSEELLLMVLEFSDHFASRFYLDVVPGV